MIWWTADLHFMHNNVLKFCPNRKCNTIQEHDEIIVNNINAVVKEDDILIFVGDVSMSSKSQIRKIIQKIKCKNIILVRGNHDNKKSLPTDCFVLIVERLSMIISGKPVLISHFPYKWSLWKRFIDRLRFIKKDKHKMRRPSDNGAFLIHGHTHSTNKYNKRMIHVGIDAWDMKPVPHFEIERAINIIAHQEKINKINNKFYVLYNKYFKKFFKKIYKKFL